MFSLFPPSSVCLSSFLSVPSLVPISTDRWQLLSFRWHFVWFYFVVQNSFKPIITNLNTTSRIIRLSLCWITRNGLSTSRIFLDLFVQNTRHLLLLVGHLRGSNLADWDMLSLFVWFLLKHVYPFLGERVSVVVVYFWN